MEQGELGSQPAERGEWELSLIISVGSKISVQNKKTKCTFVFPVRF